MAHIVNLINPKRYKLVYEMKSKAGRKRKSKTFPVGTTLREVQAYKRKMEDQFERSEGIYYCKKTVAQMVEIFMEMYGSNLSPSTYRSYTSSFYAKPFGIVEQLGSLEFQKVRLSHVQEYCNFLDSAGKSIKTIKNRVMLIHTLFDKMRKLGYLERDAINPAEDVEFPRKKSQKKEPYDFDEIHMMLRLVEEYGNPFLTLAVHIGIFTGARRSEIAALRFEDIDFQDKVIRINKALVRGLNDDYLKETKTEAGNREIPVPDDLLELLKKRKVEYQKNRLKYGRIFEDSGYLFSDEYGHPYTVSSISNRWQRFQDFAEKRGLRKLPFHFLRHCYCTCLVVSGADIKSIQSLLGHASAMMSLDVYSGALMSQKVKAVDSLDKMLKSYA